MKLRSLLLVIVFISFLLLAVQVDAQSKGSVSTNEPWLKSKSYSTSQVSLNGLVDQAGYFNFTATTSAGSMIWISWRHNADDMDIIVASNETGFLAVAWRSTQPNTTNPTDLVNTSKVIIGANGQVRGDVGSANGVHANDTADKLINSTFITDSSGIRMQFEYPLNDTSSPNQFGFTAGYYGFFAFATGSEKSLDAKFDDTNSVYVPWVYIGTWMDISYWPPETSSGLPFGTPLLIILALFVVPVIKKIRS